MFENHSNNMNKVMFSTIAHLLSKWSIGAFLQSFTQHVTYTILPKEWAELLPEHEEWFGRPLRLVKALYGDTTANKCWDDKLSSWLVGVYGFQRCLAEPSIYVKREKGRS